MYLYYLFQVHFRPWTIREIVCFTIIIVVAAIIICNLLYQKKILCSQAIAGLLMLICLGIIFASTVFTRWPEPQRLYQLNLFWSWREVLFHRNRELLKENVLNLLLLFPVGILLPPVFHRKLPWWSGLLAGVMVSAGIEFCQLAFYRGLFEWDDMIHNSIGCMAGCLLSGTVSMAKRNNADTASAN